MFYSHALKLYKFIKMERNQNIHIIGMPFSSDLLRLTTPTVLQNGNSHFTRIVFDDSPLYFQTPRCETKQGIVTTTTKKTYYDLVLDSNSETSHSPKEFKAFVEWMQTLEDAVIKLLHSNGKLWFRDPLSEDDVRGLFASPLKPLKGGNQLSLRVNVPTSVTRANACTVFDESEKPVHLSYLTPEHQIISIIEVLGVRFTSSSFQMDLSCKQIAAVSNQPLFQSCVIKKDVSLYSYAPTTSAISTATTTATATATATATPGSGKREDTELKQLLETDIIIEPQEPPIIIHDPLKIYYSLYKAALKRAKDAKRMSIQAFLDAKNIKNKYNLDIYDEDYNDDDDDDDDDDDANNDSQKENDDKDDIDNEDNDDDNDNDNDECTRENGLDSDSETESQTSETSETTGKPPIKIIGNENISISIEEVLTSK